MKNAVASCLLVLLMVTFFSCSKSGGECEEPIDATRSSEVVVTFRDKATGRYLYSEVNPMYNKDSLKVYDPSGKSLVILSQSRTIPNTSSGFFALSFGNLYDAQADQSAFDNEVCKKFIIKYNATETDTVMTCFRILKTKCGSVFNPIKVYHKGQLLDSTAHDGAAHITLFKQ